ncbi:hypothetical protein LV457_06740 [Mycobacterium sp. MYCO198283]|uniref:BadF/BadG/BcrA/BcrD ATPase family protein n=1 Tax=Mycobacterium sp. MYCO198283 TaxID=2883505 RepID=UPI001E31E603|nr:BadF/BadG/BcrA/BcrD ATPase family protein [Mycobacterium sp. MYCO198283]MCG5431987.1 hypothetical protein [Mycobacterium sp. MYCO198283]
MDSSTVGAVLVGVDSGGTRTNVEILVDSPTGTATAKYEAGDSLSGALDPALIPKILGRILAPLPARLDQLVTSSLPISIWVSAAGYTPWTRDEFTNALHQLGPTLGDEVTAIGAANDAVSLLVGSGAQGIVIAGTGSSVLVRDTNGDIHQAGGHEWVACDYGSGFWIGLEAIRKAFRDFEAGNDSVLLQRLRQAYGVRSSDDRGLIAKMRDLAIADPNMKREIARFTADVCGAAERGDTDAQNLVKSAAEDLADVTAVALRRRFTLEELSRGLKLVQCGSLLNNYFYRSAFEAQIEMRLRSGFESQVRIEWDRALTAEGACLALARRMSSEHRDLVRLPIEFRPTIVQF